MSPPTIRFSWADAWILLSVIYASRESGSATLRDFIAVADGIEHAVLNYGEADEGLARLIEAGHITRDGTGFRPAEPVLSAYGALCKSVPGVRDQLHRLEGFLGAEPWSPEYRPSADSSGRAVSRQEFEAAVQSYTSQFRR
jgi:hypothetical protein